MKRPTKTERLIDDVLSGSASPQFQQDTLEQTLRHVRRRRRARAAGRTLLAVAVLTAAAFWLWPRQRPVTTTKQIQPEPPVVVVATQPLPPGTLVETQPQPVAEVSTATPVTYVATLPADQLFEQVNDEQLLVLVAGQPIALVRYGPHEAALIMPDEILRNGFRVQ